MALYRKALTLPEREEVYFEAQSIKNVSAEGDKVFMAFKTENGDKQEILNLILNEKEAAHLASRLNYELVRMYKGGKDED